MLKVLMVGPARNVKGGMSTVIDNYYNSGLDKMVKLKYIESCTEGNVLKKIIKELIGIVVYLCHIPFYDIVHVHMASRRSTFRKAIYIRIAKILSKKIVIHIHGGEYKMFINECTEKKKKYVKKVLNYGDNIIVLSKEWKEYFSQLVDSKKITVLYNSIVIPEDFVKNLDSHDILYLGKIVKGKGIYDLLDAIAILSTTYPDIKLYICGDGENQNLIKKIYDNNITNNVVFKGWISGNDKEKLLENCSYFILPSYNEGMPMSVLEGMAFKNVTLSSMVGGVPEIINNKKNGILFKPGDIDEIVNAFKEVFDDKDMRMKLSDNARKTIENSFDINKGIKILYDIYTSM